MKKLLITTTLLYLFSSCGTKDPVKIAKDHLTSDKWYLEKMTTHISSHSIDTEYVYLPTIPCLMDDFDMYYEDGAYEANEGETKCYEGDPQISNSGTWTINKDVTLLTLTTDYGREISVITTLNENQMVLKTSEQDGDELNVYMMYYKH